LVAQDEALDLVGGVGANAQHYPAERLREHLVDQLQQKWRIMPRPVRQRSSRSATMRQISVTHSLDFPIGSNEKGGI